MQQSPRTDQEQSTRRTATIVGVLVGVASTVFAYLVIRLDPYTPSPVLTAFAWAGYVVPVVVAIGLAFSRRTRAFAVGLAGALALTWLVATPTCVVVTLNTVPLG